MSETKRQFKTRASSLVPDVLADELEHRNERRAWRESRRERLGYGVPAVVNESRSLPRRLTSVPATQVTGE